MSDTNYEIKNAEVQATLKDIGARITAGLPSALWGFMLMIFEYGKPGDPGANFYISSADRADVSNVLREWLARQPAAKIGMVEHNPDHPTTKSAHDNWHKIVALLLHKYGGVLGEEVLFTGADIATLQAAYAGDMPSVLLDDKADGLHLRMVTGDEAAELAKSAEGARTQ